MEGDVMDGRLEFYLYVLFKLYQLQLESELFGG